jgi:hypothetical protein
MGEIYQNATITVAAANAKTVEHGFLAHRPPIEILPLPIILFENSFGTLCLSEAVSERTMYPTMYHSILKDEPLFSRGWALQEYALSERVILYDKDLVTWNCSSQPFKRFSSGTVMYSCSERKYFDRIRNARSNGRELVLASTPHERAESLNWNEVISESSRRDFAFFGDRLPAISGLAQEFALVTGDECLAGLWKKDIPWSIG